MSSPMDKVTTLHTGGGIYVEARDFEYVCKERDAAKEDAETQRAAALGYRQERDEAAEAAYGGQQLVDLLRQERDEANARARCHIEYADKYKAERDTARAEVALLLDAEVERLNEEDAIWLEAWLQATRQRDRALAELSKRTQECGRLEERVSHWRNATEGAIRVRVEVARRNRLIRKEARRWKQESRSARLALVECRRERDEARAALREIVDEAHTPFGLPWAKAKGLRRRFEWLRDEVPGE